MRPSHVARGAFWIGLYLLVVLAPVLLLLVGPTPPRRTFWVELSVAFGFCGLSMLGLMFLMTARFRRAAAPFGIDVVYQFHRQISLVAMALVVAHPVILFVTEPSTRALLDPFTAPWRARAAWGALLAFVLVMVTSLWRRALRLAYEPWRLLHGLLATLGIVLAFAHLIGVNHYLQTPAKRVLWVLLGAAWIGLLLWVRVVKPLLMLRRPYEVVDVRRERGDAWTLTVAPRGHPGLDFAPGQFAWLTVWSSPFAVREHPFSFSSSPDPTSAQVSFTIKEVGDLTETIKDVRPGQRVYLDGAYGQFSVDRHRSPGYVFVGAGSGITPLLSNLRALADRADPRPTTLFYGSRSWAETTLREDIDELRERLYLTVVHVVEDPDPGWDGETGYVDASTLRRHLPRNFRDLDYFVCGPDLMMDAVEEALIAELGVPIAQVHSERYDLA